VVGDSERMGARRGEREREKDKREIREGGDGR